MRGYPIRLAVIRQISRSLRLTGLTCVDPIAIREQRRWYRHRQRSKVKPEASQNGSSMVRQQVLSLQDNTSKF